MIRLEFLEGNGDHSNVLTFEDVFYVLLDADSDRSIELWDLDSKRGWCQLSFQLTDLDSGQKYLVRRAQPDDSILRAAKKSRKPGYFRDSLLNGRRQGGILKIDARGRYRFPVLLSDCQVSAQDWTALPKSANRHRFSIVAQFESAAKRLEARFWTGAIRSDGVELRILNGQPQSPLYYLNQGFPEKALRLLKSEPFWISKRDGQSETPLHIAASSGDEEVVKWLLEHGADVNATADSQYTPLHLASDPETVALILEKKPDLTRRDAWGQTVMQRAAQRWASAASVEKQPKWRAIAVEAKRKWRAIANLYLKAGADYDILSAIQFDDLARVKALPQQSPRPAGEIREQSPLRLAASLGRLDICRFLIEQKHADVDDLNGAKGFPIIKDAVAYPKVVQLLIAQGANHKLRFTEHYSIGENATLLHCAVENGAPATIRLLIDNGVDVFATASGFDAAPDLTALDVAAYYGSADNAAAIVQHAKFRVCDRARRLQLLNRCLSNGSRPSELRSERNADRPGLLRTLLEAGADPNCAENGVTALQRLARHDFILVPDSRATHPDDPDGESTALIKAAIIKEIKVLHQHGARLDLFSAVAIGDEVEVARLLQQSRALANSKSFDGYPALLEAVALDRGNVVKQLLDAGCDVDIREEFEGWQGDTALFLAADLERSCIAKLLIDRGANVNAATADPKRTPLQRARVHGDVQLEKLLLEKGAKSGPP